MKKLLLIITLTASMGLCADEAPISDAKRLGSFELPEVYWNSWTYSDDLLSLRSDGSKLATWNSNRGINDITRVMAILKPDNSGVLCSLFYMVPNDDVEGYSQTVPGILSGVTTYPGLPQAMSQCRKAIEAKLSLRPAPIKDAKKTP